MGASEEVGASWLVGEGQPVGEDEDSSEGGLGDSDEEGSDVVTSGKRLNCVGPETPICVGLMSDGISLDADELSMICVGC